MLTSYCFVFQDMSDSTAGTGSGSGSGRSGSGDKGRSVTRLKGLTARRVAREKTQVEVDPRSGKVSGPNAAKFKSYLGLLARHHVPITTPSWDDVEETEKNLMWQDVQVFLYLLKTLYIIIN